MFLAGRQSRCKSDEDVEEGKHEESRETVTLILFRLLGHFGKEARPSPDSSCFIVQGDWPANGLASQAYLSSRTIASLSLAKSRNLDINVSRACNFHDLQASHATSLSTSDFAIEVSMAGIASTHSSQSSLLDIASRSCSSPYLNLSTPPPKSSHLHSTFN